MSDDLDYLAERLSAILETGDVTGTERDFIEGIMSDGWQEALWHPYEDGDEEERGLLDQIRRAKQIIQNH